MCFPSSTLLFLFFFHNDPFSLAHYQKKENTETLEASQNRSLYSQDFMLRKIWREHFVQQLKERRPSSSQSNQYESSPLQNPTNTCVRLLEEPIILLIHTRKFFSFYMFWIACFILNVNRASMLHGDAWNL